MCSTCYGTFDSTASLTSHETRDGSCEGLPLCATCSSSVDHDLCGTKEQPLDTGDLEAVDDYYKMYFGHMPKNRLEQLKNQWSNVTKQDGPFAKLELTDDQHERNVTTMTGILNHACHTELEAMFAGAEKLNLGKAWGAMFKSLRTVVETVAQWKTEQRNRRTIMVNIFMFEPHTYKIEHKYHFEDQSLHHNTDEGEYDQLFRAVSLSRMGIPQQLVKKYLKKVPRSFLSTDFRMCARCKYATTDASQFLTHNLGSHPRKNPDIWSCPVCKSQVDLSNESHECKGYLQSVEFGTQEFFMTYRLKFLKLELHELFHLCNSWINCALYLMDDEPKSLFGGLQVKNATKLDRSFLLSAILRLAIEPKEHPALTIEALQQNTEEKFKGSPIVIDVLEMAQKEQGFVTRKTTEHTIAVQIYDLNVFRDFLDNNVDKSVWEESSVLSSSMSLNGCQILESPTVETTQNGAIHGDEEIYEAVACDDASIGETAFIRDALADREKSCSQDENDFFFSRTLPRRDSEFDGREREQYYEAHSYDDGREVEDSQQNHSVEHSTNNDERWCDQTSSRYAQQICGEGSEPYTDDIYHDHLITTRAMSNQADKLRELRRSAGHKLCTEFIEKEDHERVLQMANYIVKLKAAEDFAGKAAEALSDATGTIFPNRRTK
ncbi:hypothetical protein Forpi1262_v017197 [Fusarium oxysporum f. sp. raphani]|uniref:Uncharacterized protein n=1 Tax=Fusarium oxysporum f. sp. raphani TaxID=96318 RepID=A0A8J5P772_FUSOX|nr:hypothetical protein Forpi1262_v017197 [Fusarium oxysporum f. sp. raphani]